MNPSQQLLMSYASSVTPPPSSIIVSIQKGTITIGGGTLSNTATISSVDVNNSVIIYGGQTSNATSDASRAFPYLELVDATTVRASRKASTNTSTVTYTVIEFESSALASNVQSGLIDITSGNTNTATISAVGANALVLYLGVSSSSGTNSGNNNGTVTLTNSTTVTAVSGPTVSSGTFTISYMVLDLDSSVVESIQARSVTNATSATSYNDTISSVDVDNTILLLNGYQGASYTQFAHTLQLTSSTNVSLTRISTNTNSRTIKYTALEFKAGILNSAVQRGVINIPSGTSNTATISSVNTSKSICNYAGWNAANGAIDDALNRVTLTDATTVTANVNTSGNSNTISYEISEFV